LPRLSSTPTLPTRVTRSSLLKDSHVAASCADRAGNGLPFIKGLVTHHLLRPHGGSSSLFHAASWLLSHYIALGSSRRGSLPGSSGTGVHPARLASNHSSRFAVLILLFVLALFVAPPLRSRQGFLGGSSLLSTRPSTSRAVSVTHRTMDRPGGELSRHLVSSSTSSRLAAHVATVQPANARHPPCYHAHTPWFAAASHIWFHSIRYKRLGAGRGGA